MCQDGVRIRLDAVVNNLLAFNPRRNEVGWNTDTSGVKFVGEILAINSRAGEGVVILILMLIVGVIRQKGHWYKLTGGGAGLMGMWSAKPPCSSKVTIKRISSH